MKARIKWIENVAFVAESGSGHAFVMDVATYPKMFMITDAAVNIFPDLETKRDIAQNAIEPWSKPHYRSHLAELKRAAPPVGRT